MSLRAVASRLTRTHMPGLGGVQTRAFAKGEMRLGVRVALSPELRFEASPTR